MSNSIYIWVVTNPRCLERGALRTLQDGNWHILIYNFYNLLSFDIINILFLLHYNFIPQTNDFYLAYKQFYTLYWLSTFFFLPIFFCKLQIDLRIRKKKKNLIYILFIWEGRGYVQKQWITSNKQLNDQTIVLALLLPSIIPTRAWRLGNSPLK